MSFFRSAVATRDYQFIQNNKHKTRDSDVYRILLTFANDRRHFITLAINREYYYKTFYMLFKGRKLRLEFA